MRVIYLEEDALKAMSDPAVKQKDESFKEHFNDCYAPLFHKNYLLNTSKFENFAFKAMSLFSNKSIFNKTQLLGKNFTQKLDKAVGLHRLPQCVGGTNPIPLADFKNFFDQEIEASFEKRRLGLK